MKKLLFLSAAFAIALVACSKDKSEDLIEPMTKSGDVTTFAEGKEEVGCTGQVWTVLISPAGVPYYALVGYSGKKCRSGFSVCSYTDACSPLKK